MYPVSEKFMQAINSNARRYYWTGTIKTNDGQEYAFDNNNIVKGSGYITRSCCGSSAIELGSAYAAELGISLITDIDRYTLDGAEVRLAFHLILGDGTEEEIPMGIFEVTEANRKIKTLEIKAYDYMLRFDKPFAIDASSGRPYNYLQTLCTDCEVELGMTKEEIEALPNGTATLGIYQENDIETYRDVLFYLAQALGCIAQINREGQLVLIPYSGQSVCDISWQQRYDSNYSDFVTRYTAVSSTNMITQEAEYYALEVDDGLTMNLEMNPLLQFGLKATRERLLRAILNAIAVVEYVPFDSNTIGNPALDPMDCLRFTGGHADETKISCITSITYKINDKQTLKCVGKNPKLAEAKSKNDKNISGIIGQIETNKTVVYDFMNVEPCTVTETPMEVMSIDYVAKESTSAMFLAEIIINITADDEERTILGTAKYDDGGQVEKEVTFDFTGKAHPILTVTYINNSKVIATFIPEQVCHEGKQIITLFYPLSEIVENSSNTLSVLLNISGGTGYIAEENIRATISGQGLVSGIADWNGRLSFEDDIPKVMADFDIVNVRNIDNNVSITFPGKQPFGVQQNINVLHLDFSGMTLRGLNERIVAGTVIKTATISTEFESGYNYDRTLVQTTNNRFALRTAYRYEGTPATVDSGLLTKVELPYTTFDEVTEVEVEK